MRVAVIGCGTIGQIMHIPYLAELPATEIDALVDPAVGRRKTLGERYDVPHRYSDASALLADRADVLDAVVVCTPSHTHADVVTASLDAGIHTLVEKPLAADPADADRMVEAAEASDAVAMVGYMKRYDPAYELAQTKLAQFDDIDLVTAYDVDPDHLRIIDEVYDLVEADLPESFIEESTTARRESLIRAVGTEDPFLLDAYDFQIEHVCHDLNALRGLFGKVTDVEHVDVFADGRYATATLRYDDLRCVLETGDSDRKWFEEYFRVDAPDGMLRLDFSNPFIRNTPTELQIKRGTASVTDTVHTPSYDESFKRELVHFVACVHGEASVRTPFSEARDDVRLVAELFRTYQDDAPRGGH